MLNKKQREYIEALLKKYEGPTHKTDYFSNLGLGKFIVFEGVLSPEKSAISPLFARFLYKHQKLYKNKDILELGCGSGILSIIMAKYGARKVVATDILDIAVENTKENSKIYKLDSILEVRKGDLFEPIKEDEQFDLIVFNHPFFQGRSIEGNPISVAFLDEGNLIKRFLSKIPSYLKQNGKIIMAFSEIAGNGNDPKIHAANYSLEIKVMNSFESNAGKRFIYELAPRT